MKRCNVIGVILLAVSVSAIAQNTQVTAKPLTESDVQLLRQNVQADKEKMTTNNIGPKKVKPSGRTHTLTPANAPNNNQCEDFFINNISRTNAINACRMVSIPETEAQTKCHSNATNNPTHGITPRYS